MFLRQFAIDGLGHLSTLIADESAGLAAVVDPRRDVDIYLDAARQHDLRISHVVETHLHNDYVSGGRDLAALTGATHVIGAGAELAYEHRPVRHGETFDVGQLRFTVLETPGHTPEHVAYAVADRSRADEPLLLFTGGSLLVGAVGRTDLLGAENALPFARAMFRSLHEVVLPHEDYVGVYPTHGAGSLCSTGHLVDTVLDRRLRTPPQPDGRRRGRRRVRDDPADRPAGVPALLRPDAADEPGRPAAPRRSRAGCPAPRRRRGPGGDRGRSPGDRPAIALGPRDEPHPGLAVDPGRARPSGRGWAGSSTTTGPSSSCSSDLRDWDDAIRQALRIGQEQVVGHLRGGFASWSESDAPIEAGGRLTVDQLAAQVDRGGSAAPLVIDVRQLSEYESAHVPGSLHLAAGSLPDRLDELPRDRPIATVCGSGYRASVAASLLRAAGFRDVSWVADGVPGVAAPRPRGRARGAARRRGHDHGRLRASPPTATATRTRRRRSRPPTSLPRPDDADAPGRLSRSLRTAPHRTPPKGTGPM